MLISSLLVTVARSEDEKNKARRNSAEPQTTRWVWGHPNKRLVSIFRPNGAGKSQVWTHLHCLPDRASVIRLPCLPFRAIPKTSSFPGHRKPETVKFELIYV